MKRKTYISIFFTLIILGGCARIPYSTFSVTKPVTEIDIQYLSGDKPINSRPDVGLFAVHQPEGLLKNQFEEFNNLRDERVAPATNADRIVFHQPDIRIDTPPAEQPVDSIAAPISHSRVISLEAEKAYNNAKSALIFIWFPYASIVLAIIANHHYKLAKSEIEANPDRYSNANQMYSAKRMLTTLLIIYLVLLLIFGILIALAALELLSFFGSIQL